MIGEGKIRAVNGRTLISIESLREYVAGLLQPK
jgi:hypothetical protein